MDTNKIKVIGFDADDTLWVNEPYYRDTENDFSKIMEKFGNKEFILKKLLDIEVANIPLYGFGTKAFMLSMVETALIVSNNNIDQTQIGEIIKLGKAQIKRENKIFPDVEKVLNELSCKYRLVVATKGDLLDQERKLKNSGLLKYFHHIEIMSDKKVENYRQLLNRLDVCPSEFLMVGNSLKSDIIPVIELKSQAIHIPFHTTWVYEEASQYKIPESKYIKVGSIREILQII